MKKIAHYTWSVLLMALFCSQPLFAQEESSDSKVPSIKLKDLSGKEVDFKSYAENGKITIVSFWATWCSPCKKELDNINVLLPEWEADYGVELIAVSIDNARNATKVKPYVSGKGWDFDVLLDVNEDTKRALNYGPIPYAIIIDQKGEIVYKHSGYYEGDEYALEDEIIKILEKE